MPFSAILFNKAHAKSLEYEHRLPPTSIGARRIRPSSTVVLKEMKRQKRLKKHCEKEDAHISALNDDSSDGEIIIDAGKTSLWGAPGENNGRDYFQMKIHPRQIQEEIDEIRGSDRSAYHSLPVLLTPEMSFQAAKHNLLMGAAIDTQELDGSLKISYSDTLTEDFAKVLQEVISHAEDVRSKEQMRPMAYRLVPEKWTRLRPNRNNTVTNSKNIDQKPETIHPSKQMDAGDVVITHSLCVDTITAWQYETKKVVCDYLYNEYLNIQMADGSKFGADYLLYDDTRNQRHAFAGIRILSSLKAGQDDHVKNFPLPSAFDLHGFVRALNTAGKLALVATAVKNELDDSFQVAIVDLALEKVLGAPVHQKRQRLESRKEVGKNLSKV